MHSAGVIRGDLAEAGLDLPVGSLLCVLADDASTEQEVAAFISAFAPLDGDSMEVTGETDGDIRRRQRKPDKAGQEDELKQGDAGTEAIPASLQGVEDDAQVPATHLARKLARRLAINLHKITGSGRHAAFQAGYRAGDTGRRRGNARSRPKPARQAATAGRQPHTRNAAGPQSGGAGRNHLAEVTPTGARGRVTKTDVEKAMAANLPATSRSTATGSSARHMTKYPSRPCSEPLPSA